MQNNLGYFYYNCLYSNTGGILGINSQNKKLLLERDLFDEEKKYSIKNLDIFQLYTTYPGLTTGTGMPHGIKDQDEDFKIGFYFDHTTGLPAIPGSSVKGVLRSAFPVINKKTQNNITEFVFDKNSNEKVNRIKACWIKSLLDNITDKDFLDKHYEPAADIGNDDIVRIYSLINTIFEGMEYKTFPESQDKHLSIYNRDTFYDAIITESGKEGKIIGTDSITPHVKDDMPYEKAMLKNPKPLLFLKVMPNVEFTFHFSLTDNGLKKEEKLRLFEHILLTIGAGAKTNVGYGQFTRQKGIPDRALKSNEVRQYETKNSSQKNAESVNSRQEQVKRNVNSKSKSEPVSINKKIKVGDKLEMKVCNSNTKKGYIIIDNKNTEVEIVKNCPDEGHIVVSEIAGIQGGRIQVRVSNFKNLAV